MLPASKRTDVKQLYAWCRWCDDGVDAAESPEDAANFVDRAIQDLQRIADGRTPHAVESLWLADLIERYDLPIEAAEALVEGFKSDLTPASGFDENGLMQYCFRVAGAVGVLLCPILGLKEKSYLPHAAALGIGMQLTNIARDVAEDWRQSRCYLPVEWTGGPIPSDSPPPRDRVRSGVRKILEVADDFYAAGESGITALEPGSRLGVRAASRIYRAIGEKIKRQGYHVLDGRTRVSLVEKVAILLPLAVGQVSEISAAKAINHRTHALKVSARLLEEHGVKL